ncbi:MAG: hypothetical protein IKS85_06450 [Lachnospiraceae bacterium]|nr:hypothetical protein [Lachnospiraceae bacterium]
MELNNSAFPRDEIDALTLLYLGHLDLSGLAPEEIYEKYVDAHKRLENLRDQGAKEAEENY